MIPTEPVEVEQNGGDVGAKRQTLRAALPVFALAGLLFVSGDFDSVGWRHQAIVALLLGGAALAGFSSRRDPLSLGRKWAWLPWALVGILAASNWVSPVRRAGQWFIVAAPLLLLCPAGIAWCWADEPTRRRGFMLLRFMIFVLATVALVDFWATDLKRAAAPLGHHNLLAIVLVALWPLSLPVPGNRRPWLSILPAFAALATLVATRSLAGGLAVTVQALLLARDATRVGPRSAVFGNRRSAWLGGGVFVALLIAVLLAPRVGSVLAGRDLSSQARWGYGVAALRGFSERPLFGQGPRATAWLLPWHLSGKVAVANQVVTDTHSLPLEVLYETGFAGAVAMIAVLAAFVSRRRNEQLVAEAVAPPNDRSAGSDHPAERWRVGTAKLAFVGIVVASLFAGWFDVPAVLATAIFVVGVGLAHAPSTLRPLPRLRWWVLGLVIWALFVAYGLRSARWYERALGTLEPAVKRQLLSSAVRADPDFPLYRLRFGALLEEEARRAGGPPGVRSFVAEPVDAPNQSLYAAAFAQAWSAAGTAPGLLPAWLLAGRLAHEARFFDLAAEAFSHACQLDARSAWAPFLAASSTEDGGLRAERLARSLLAEPRLLGAAAGAGFARQETASVVRALTNAETIPVGWRQGLLDSWSELAERFDAAPSEQFEVDVDRQGEVSLSLYAFRRPPAPLTLMQLTAVAVSAPPPPVLDVMTSTSTLGGADCGLSPWWRARLTIPSRDQGPVGD